MRSLSERARGQAQESLRPRAKESEEFEFACAHSMIDWAYRSILRYIRDRGWCHRSDHFVFIPLYTTESRAGAGAYMIMYYYARQGTEHPKSKRLKPPYRTATQFKSLQVLLSTVLVSLYDISDVLAIRSSKGIDLKTSVISKLHLYFGEKWGRTQPHHQQLSTATCVHTCFCYPTCCHEFLTSSIDSAQNQRWRLHYPHC